VAGTTSVILLLYTSLSLSLSPLSHAHARVCVSKANFAQQHQVFIEQNIYLVATE